MADEPHEPPDDAPRGAQPAVITFRPDNFLTVGLIALIVYAASVALVQVAMRAGLIATPKKPAAAPVIV